MLDNKTPLLFDKINKSFKKKRVLDDISLKINEGDVFGLIGLNGAGKTTMIKIMLGLLKQDSGNVNMFGQDVHSPEARKNLSFLPEKFQPSAYLKGREFLELTLSYYSKKYNHNEGREGAKMLHLDPDALDLKITKYSKGMTQKLGLLSALLSHSPLLMLDEPMSGLDPRARIQLKDSLTEYSSDKNTIFFSSHILSDIDEICNRIAILHDTKMIFVGTPGDFKEKYKDKSLERSFLKAIGEGKENKAA